MTLGVGADMLARKRRATQPAIVEICAVNNIPMVVECVTHLRATTVIVPGV